MLPPPSTIEAKSLVSRLDKILQIWLVRLVLAGKWVANNIANCSFGLPHPPEQQTSKIKGVVLCASD